MKANEQQQKGRKATIGNGKKRKGLKTKGKGSKGKGNNKKGMKAREG